MPKFRRKPMIVEAEQYWNGDGEQRLIPVNKPYWIITEATGEWTIYSQESFEGTFEKVLPDLDKVLTQEYPVDYSESRALHPFVGDLMAGSELCEGCGEHYSWHQT